VEITRITTFEFSQKPVQEFCDGRGNKELNRVRKDSSDVQCHAGVLPNDLEGTSEIELSLPSMWSVVNGQVLFVLILRASACTKCSATSNLQEAKRFVHPTTGELSLNSATRFPVRVGTLLPSPTRG
jgi:hypothetical protein